MLKAATSAYGNKVWMRKKRSGLWHEYSWQDGYDRVKRFSLGLTSLGFERGQALCIIGDSDPQWFWAEIAAQAAGGSVIGFNCERPAGEMKAVVRQFGVKFVVVQGREQVEKLLEIKPDLPGLVKVIYWNAKGLEEYRDPVLATFDEVSELGQRLEASHSGVFEEGIAQRKGMDTAFVQCGSINSSEVQSTAFNHEHLVAASESFRSMDPLNSKDRWFSSILPEGTVEQVISLVGGIASGICLDYPENRDTAQQDLREVGPTLVCHPSPFWEGLVSTVDDRIAKTTFVKRVMFRAAAPVGSRLADARLDGRKTSLSLRAAGALTEFGFFRPLKARLGLANTRRVYAFGPELAPKTLKALLNMGLDVRDLDISRGTVVVRHQG